MGELDLLELLDDPLVNSRIFFPRPDPGREAPPGSEDLQVDVGPGVSVAVRFYPAAPPLPVVLHFHGNGEIVADYDTLAPSFHGAGASLVCADFRGYGRSTGRPSVGTLTTDAHAVLDAVQGLLERRGHGGPLVVMGRSLGSAPAIDLAWRRGEEVAGLIIESGFARTEPLLELFGISFGALGLDARGALDNEHKMGRVKIPLLVLHAAQDDLLPPWHAEHNYNNAATPRKRLVTIPGADHNTILVAAAERYWGAIAEFLQSL